MSHTKEGRDSDWIETLSIAVALAFIAWFVISEMLSGARRAVVFFAPADAFTITDAAPGDWVQMSIPVKKRRDCELTSDSKLLITYRTDDEFHEAQWSRDGPYLSPSKEWQQGRITFRVPSKAPVGPAAAIFDAEFECNIGNVRHRAPAARFTILEPLPEPNG